MCLAYGVVYNQSHGLQCTLGISIELLVQCGLHCFNGFFSALRRTELPSTYLRKT